MGVSSSATTVAASAAETVDVAGGDISVVTTTSTTGVSAVSVDGTTCPFFVIDSTRLAVITPAKTAGTKNVVLTNAGGAGPAAAVMKYHDPADANTTLLLERGNYVGDTWVDRSANAAHFTHATLYAPETNKEPQLNEAGQDLHTLVSTKIGSDFITGTDAHITIMFRARKLLPSNSVAWYLSSPLIYQNGAFFGVVVTDSYIRVNINGTAYVEIPAAPSLNDWHVVDIDANAGDWRMRIDGGAWTSATTATAGTLTQTWVLGDLSGDTSGDSFEGDLRVVQVSNTSRSDAWSDDNLDWLRSRHAFRSTAGEPEIDSADSDVFEPAGGDRIFVKGRNLDLTDAYVGDTATKNVVEALSACPYGDGVNDKLELPGTLDAYYNAASYSGWALVMPRTLATPAGAPYDDACIFTGYESVYACTSLANGQASIYHFDGANKIVTVPIRTGVWTLLQWVFDGTTLKLRANGGPWQPVAAGNLTSLSQTARLLASRDGAAKFLNAIVAEVGLADTAVSDANHDNVLAGINYDFGLNLGGVAASSFDRATLSPTVLLKAGNYASGTWTATVGSNATEATNPPAVYSHAAKRFGTFGAMPDFGGVNHKLDFNGGATTLDDLFNDNAGTLTILYWSNVSATPSTAYDVPNLMATTSGAAFLNVGVDKDGPHVSVYDGVQKQIRLYASRYAWNVLQMKWNGTTLYARVNGDPWQQVAAGPIGSMINTVRLGLNYDSTQYYTGFIGLVLASATFESDTACDDIVKAINFKYGFNFGGLTPTDLDFSTLTFTVRLEPGEYTSGTWNGLASAGTSGSNDATEATNPPRVSSGEHLVATMPAKSASKVLGPMPRCAGIDQRFSVPVANNVAIGTSGFVYAVLNLKSLPAPVGFDYGDGNIFTDLTNAETTFGVTTAGVTACLYTGTFQRVDLAWGAVNPLDEWHFVAMRYNGTTLEVSIDGGTWESTPSGSPSFLTPSAAIAISRSYGATGLNGLLLEWGCSTVAHSDADVANIIAGINEEYGLNIGGITPAAFNRASLPWTVLLRKYSKETGIMQDNASTGGSSGSRHAVSATGGLKLAEVTIGGEPLVLVNASGVVANTHQIEVVDIAAEAGRYHHLRADLGATTAAGGTELASLEDQVNDDVNKDIATGAASGTPTNPEYTTSDPVFGGRASWGTSYATAEAGKFMRSGTFVSPLAPPFTAYDVYCIAQGGASNSYPRIDRSGNSVGPSEYGTPSSFLATNDGSITISWVLQTGIAIVDCVVYDDAGKAFPSRYTKPAVTGDLNQGINYASLGTGTYPGQASWLRMAEKIVFSGAHSASQRRRITKCLGSRYQIKVAA